MSSSDAASAEPGCRRSIIRRPFGFHCAGLSCRLSAGDRDVGSIWQLTARTWQEPLNFNFVGWNRLFEEEQPTWQRSH